MSEVHYQYVAKVHIMDGVNFRDRAIETFKQVYPLLHKTHNVYKVKRGEQTETYVVAEIHKLI